MGSALVDAVKSILVFLNRFPAISLSKWGW